jgi:hypothetical protein
MNACCTGWSAGVFCNPFFFAYQAGRPSSVMIALPSRDPTCVTHERVSTPSMRTEQEPHCAKPQPNRGPWRSNSFERTYSRGVSGLDSTGHKRSFTLILSPAAIWECPPVSSPYVAQMLHPPHSQAQSHSSRGECSTMRVKANIFVISLVEWLEFDDRGAVVIADPESDRRCGIVDEHSSDVRGMWEKIVRHLT